MKNLNASEAEQIHEIILHSGDKALIAQYEYAIKSQAKIRQGMGV